VAGSEAARLDLPGCKGSERGATPDAADTHAVAAAKQPVSPVFRRHSRNPFRPRSNHPAETRSPWSLPGAPMAAGPVSAEESPKSPTEAATCAISGTATSRTAQADVLSGSSKNRVVYQLNRFDPDYIKEILHSVAVVLRTYPDDVDIVVTCFGPGIWVLVKDEHNRHKIDRFIREMISSQVIYGVEFHACEQTMETVKLKANALIDGAKVVPSGAVDLIELK
jgi:intracellular sulfur oxidation DsrE/DsrF family protein